MSWLDLPADDATPELDRLSRPYREQGLPFPAVIAAMKPSPKALRAVMQMNQAVTFGGSSLGQRTEEMLATTTSILNDCFY